MVREQQIFKAFRRLKTHMDSSLYMKEALEMTEQNIYYMIEAVQASRIRHELNCLENSGKKI